MGIDAPVTTHEASGGQLVSMLERWLAFAALIALLFSFAHWANEDDAPPVAPREVTGLPSEMPEDDDDGDEEQSEREGPRDERKRPKGIVGGLLGGDD